LQHFHCSTNDSLLSSISPNSLKRGNVNHYNEHTYIKQFYPPPPLIYKQKKRLNKYSSLIGHGSKTVNSTDVYSWHFSISFLITNHNKLYCCGLGKMRNVFVAHKQQHSWPVTKIYGILCNKYFRKSTFGMLNIM
jgi:hypothetical protein